MTAGKSILVVDDCPDISEIVRISLGRLGCSVYVFDDPFKTLEHFKQNTDKVDALISDIRMPGMSGIELTSLVKEVNPEGKVFLMTAFDIDTFQSQIDSLNLQVVSVSKTHIICKDE